MTHPALGMLAALVAGATVAFVWYQKGPIARAWENATGVTPDRSRPARARNMTRLAVALAITVCGLAAAIEVTMRAVGDRSVWVALLVGVAAWLAFSASTLLQHNAFELKPDRLTIINVGYQFVLFVVVSVVLGVL